MEQGQWGSDIKNKTKRQTKQKKSHLGEEGESLPVHVKDVHSEED